MDAIAEAVREKHRKRQEASAKKYEAHKEAVENGEKKLVVEKLPTGLMSVKWEGGGALPPELKGKFTSVVRIRALAEARYGEGILK